MWSEWSVVDAVQVFVVSEVPGRDTDSLGACLSALRVLRLWAQYQEAFLDWQVGTSLAKTVQRMVKLHPRV